MHNSGKYNNLSPRKKIHLAIYLRSFSKSITLLAQQEKVSEETILLCLLTSAKFELDAMENNGANEIQDLLDKFDNAVEGFEKND